MVRHWKWMTEIEHVGNALCLDFANTVNARPTPSSDWLATPDGGHLGALGRCSRVVAAGRERCRQRGPARVVVPHLRFRGSAGGAAQARSRPARGRLRRAVSWGRLRRAKDLFTLATPAREPLETLLGEVSASASTCHPGPLERVGECPSCGWLFLDTSRNGRRRWCSMATCGSRDKARRYYTAHIGPAT